jgi:hypothetical protein
LPLDQWNWQRSWSSPVSGLPGVEAKWGKDMRGYQLCAVCLMVAGLLTGVEPAKADIWQPTGSANIVIRQGGNVIVDSTFSLGTPGAQLTDFSPSWIDGTPESFTQIGTVGPQNSPIILKLTTDGDETFRLTHWYIDVPASLADIYSAGPTSLFDPNGGAIDVTITGLTFTGGVAVLPSISDNNTYAVSFMRDVQGHFYENPLSNPYNAYGHGINDIQVPGERYLDADTGQYMFNVIQSGTTASWSWTGLANPGLTSTVHNGLATGVTPQDPGYVFELGLSAAFVQVPEPATLGLVMFGAMAMLRRRR